MESPKPNRLRSTLVSTWASLMLICLVLIGLAAAVTWNDRMTELAEARGQTANLARALADHAHNTFRLADMIVLEARDQVERDGLGPEQRITLHQTLAARVAVTPGLRTVAVCDRYAECLTGAGSIPKAGINVSEKANYRHHRDSPDRNALIGTAIRYLVDGSWVLTVSRRIDRADGSFGGIVVAVIRLDAFTDFYGSFDIGEHGVISLVRTDGRMIARHPFDEPSIGKMLPNAPTSEDLPPRPPAGDYEYSAKVDGIDRLASYRRVDPFPVVVTVALAKSEVLAHWRAQAWTRIFDLAVIVTILVLFGYRLAAQTREREQADRAMQALAAEYRLLTESLTDVVTRVGMDLVRNYVSPAARDIFGYEPEELVGKNVKSSAHPDDIPAMDRAYEAMMDSAGPGRGSYQCRARRKDGTWIWIETCGGRLSSGEGFVFTSRDISARKQAEIALEAMTREDGLTGLGNRRGFDEALEREFFRAARNAAPLSLIMIDVDWFKPFNDRFGHQAGDECLRAVAGAVARSVRRPDDITARYGGEEFAILLPDVGVGGGLSVAEQVRLAVAALAIERGHEPGQHLTISAGVAAVFPGRGAANPQDLVKAADEALYAAKHSGRDRVCVAEDPFAAERPQILLPFPCIS